MKQVPKPTTDDALIQQFLDNGGKVKQGKTKPLPSDLGISKNTVLDIMKRNRCQTL